MFESIYEVKENLIGQSGETLCSQVVQDLIDKCHANGGGIVRFGKGTYVMSTVFLKSNVTIEIAEGAEILGSENFYDYAPHEAIDYYPYQDASHTYFHHSMFVAIDCENVSIKGKGKIDMRSIWDEDGVRGEAILHRGPKCIALKNCKNVEISGIEIYNATDLAVYFAGCENVDVYGLKMEVYIDGISPDNSKNVRIHDCDIVTGDDGIVFKSSYTLNRLDICKDIHVWDCKVKSNCSAIKFGTETNGGFENILIENIDVIETCISGIAIESVDGAIVDGIIVRNITMRNVNVPIFMHIGKRMRGPKNRSIGAIRNIVLENITADGPYEPFRQIAWNYRRFIENNRLGLFEVQPSRPRYDGLISNVCGLKDYPIENVLLKNIHLKLQGGVQEYSKEVTEKADIYPEPYVYGTVLPAKGIYFRHVNGLKMENVVVDTYKPDAREDFVFEKVDFKN